MNKFKVGQYVVVTNKTFTHYNTVLRIIENDEYNECCLLDKDKNLWYSYEDLELFSKEETKSDIELLKEKYESGDYVCMIKTSSGSKFKDIRDIGIDFNYVLREYPNLSVERYKLINKKHELILKAYLDGKEIEVNGYYMGARAWIDDKDFIDKYDEIAEYRIKETKSNCEDNKVKNANVSHYDLWKDFEVIDLIKNTLTKEEYIGALKFNILKYKLRSKGQDEADNIKIQDYTRELNSILDGK